MAAQSQDGRDIVIDGGIYSLDGGHGFGDCVGAGDGLVGEPLQLLMGTIAAQAPATRVSQGRPACP